MTGYPRAVPRSKPEATRARPRKFRHWSAHDIGSELWWRDLRRLRVSRTRVEDALGPDVRARDPHDTVYSLSRAERAAYFLLLSRANPSYGAFMYVAHEWQGAGRSFKEWLVTQYAFILDEADEAWRKEALYSLWVDYFEVRDRAEFVFPRLWRRVQARSELLAHSGPVPWRAKQRAYADAAADASLHAGLARGLLGSFTDVFGSVDAVAAAASFRSIQVDDAEVHAALVRIFTEPVRFRVAAVVTVDERDERWTRWLRPNADGPSFLLAMQRIGERRSVAHASEIFHDETRLGRIVHRAFPFDRAIRHETLGELEADDAVLFRVEGDRWACHRAVGREVEVWPGGLHAVR